jgi:transcriptional regulator with XRE-family HTH domain
MTKDEIEEKRNDQRAEKQIKNKDEKIKFKHEVLEPRIIGAMEKNGINQTKLAKKLGKSDQGISQLIHNDSVPEIPNLIKLANALNVSLDYLCGNENQPNHGINTFKGLLTSIWDQYKYCEANNIPCELAKVDRWINGFDYACFIGMDINDIYVNDFLDILQEFIKFKNKGKVNDTRSNKIVESIINETSKERKTHEDIDYTRPDHVYTRTPYSSD